LDLR
jgi:hypothetical protein